MGLTSAMYTALTGLGVNQYKLDIAGNNIANVNTIAFKASDVSFKTQFAQTFGYGASPSATSGGANPVQVGMGAKLAAITPNMTQGTIDPTGRASDMAIEGAGWFLVERADGTLAYTRDGSFTLNANNELVNADGCYLRGYGVDSDFNVVPGSLGRLAVPVGEMRVAAGTANAAFDGNLNAAGDMATMATVLSSQALIDNSTGLAATAATTLADLRSGGVQILAVGDKLTLNAAKGGRDLTESVFTVTASATGEVDSGTTLGELVGWLRDALGINTSAGLTPPPGATVSGGRISITGNVGTDNELSIKPSDLRSSGAVANPFSFTASASANGESVMTTGVVYDSLGTPMTVNVTMALVDRTDLATTWRWFAECPNDTDVNLAVGTGTVTFNSQGQFLSSTGDTITIDRTDTGAASPMTVKLDFTSATSLTSNGSQMVLASQDGFPVGTLTDFAITGDGRILGTFSNTITKTLGQVVLATFDNDAGLSQISGSLFTEGANSGKAVIGTPMSGNAGKIIGGAREMSNVDLSREFINLIVASTGFSASSRVISSSNQLLSDLLQTVR